MGEFELRGGDSCQLGLSAAFFASNVTRAYCGCHIATFRNSQVHDTDSGGVDNFIMDMEQLSRLFICMRMYTLTICMYMHIHA